MAKHRLWAIAAAAGISAVLLTGCDDPGESDNPEQSEEAELDDNVGVDDDLEDNAVGDDELEDDSGEEGQPDDVATDPSE